MRRTLLFAVLSVISAVAWGQNVITGIVLDSLSQEPLPAATVYLNGTTQGTTTDNEGRFELKDVSFPTTIIFSFVGYEPMALDLTHNPGKLTVMLKANIELPEIEVSGKTNKADKADLEYFKTMFLGDDRWGKNATIKNEYALIIYKSNQISYKIRRIGKTSFSSPTANMEMVEKHVQYYDTAKVYKTVFSVWATEPLIIDLPMLGYEVYVDLVKFNVEKINTVTQCDMLGYFYYKPYEQLKKRQSRSIEENRKRAYYGSSQHFLRSLAQNRLTENGYVLTMSQKILKGKNSKPLNTYMPVNISKHSFDPGGYYMHIRGLKDKKLRLRYYYKKDYSPWNFTVKEKGLRRYSESTITFLGDTCIFLKDGIAIDNSIQFKGEMSKKRVAACLPDDYFPPSDSGRTNVKVSADYASDLIRFADNIREFNSMFPQEKVYLEFDNTAYFQGEDIWYKAFVTNASTLERAPSGVLYVDFLSPTGQLIMQQKRKIEAGQADGLIPLLDAGTYQTREKHGIVAYPSGFYEIRAYTQNMLDFSPEAIFSRVIPVYTQPKYIGEYDESHVVNDQDNPLIENLRGESKEQKALNKTVNIAFYPEGGDLIKGLPCRVAFKATGGDAFGVEGALVVSGRRDSIHTVHDGMGSFIITPNGSESLQFFTTDGNSVRSSLPKVLKSGYSMMADIDSSSLMQVNVWRTPDHIGEQTALAVTCRGELIHFEEIKDIDNVQLEIDGSNWPVGVCRVTLFNREGNILSSRSIFHNSADYRSPTITVNLDSMSRKSYSKEVIGFRLTDEDGNPFRDRFCLSVRDAADYGGGRNENLQTNLLLSSDLRGYIHDPAWYLETNDEKHREALNLLTLVQGWERYEWQYMTGLKDFEDKHRIEESLTMNGWILSYSKREPVSDIGVYASLIPDNDKTLFESFEYHTDSTGYFGFDLSDFYGKGKFTINLMSTNQNGNSQHEKSKRIRFERADRPKPRPFLMQETDLSRNTFRTYDYKDDFGDDDLSQFRNRNRGTLLDPVDIEAKASKIRFIDYDTFTSFEAEEDAELELDQGEYTTDLRGYFLERGIRLEQRNQGSLFETTEESEENVQSASDTHLKPVFYVHNLEKLLTNKPFDSPLDIDMIDVKSVIIYDKPMYPREFQDLIPLMNDWVKKHGGATPPDVPVRDAILACPDNSYWCWLDNCWQRYTLVDIQIKNDRQLLFYDEIRNLGRRTTDVKGFTRTVEFYSPQYPEGPIEGNIDARRTLYWNPNVITDEDGNARIEFYNNSYTRRFTISGAGITASGIPYVLDKEF